MTEQANFNSLVERVLEANGDVGNWPVIEKELLHYDILFALDQTGMLDDIVFQGLQLKTF